MVAKQELIDQYGHYFVLCDSHDGQHRDDSSDKYTYTSRVYDLWHYSHIGNLDYGWKPNLPDRFEIKEFLGVLPDKESHDVGVLAGLHWKHRGDSVFRTLEEAEEHFAKIQEAIGQLYEKLREEGKTRELPFDTQTPDIPMSYDLLPEDIEFPHHHVLKKGEHLHCISRNILDGEIKALKAEIFSVKLNATEIQKRHEPFKHTYEMNVSIWIPNDDNTSSLVDRTFRLRQGEDALGWTYYLSNSVRDNYLFYMSEEYAQNALKGIAQKAFNNIRAHLPEEVLKKDTVPAPTLG